jgi:Kef-type K+ transport system membrane component KefB
MTPVEYLPQFPLPANPLALFGALLLVGALGGELTRRVLNLPRITGYVIVGLALGGSGLDILDANMVAQMRVFVDVGLGLVLFELGRRLDLDWLKRDCWLAAISALEIALSFACMFGALLWFDITPLYAAAAAAIGVSSSPAIVMLVARELNAEGQVTERALNLVAINSVAAFIIVTVLLSWIHHEYGTDWRLAILHPAYLLFGSICAGALIGLCALCLARWLGKRPELHLALLLGLVVATIGIAESLRLSVLLTVLIFGMTVANCDGDHVLMPVDIGRFGQVFFVVLFVATGAMLHVGDLIAGGAISLVYIAARFVGKSIGVLCFAHLSGIRPGSGGLLSIALMPMSGIAIALTYSAGSIYPAFGSQLATIVLAAALILELAGPLAVQFALRSAGEARPEAA